MIGEPRVLDDGAQEHTEVLYVHETLSGSSNGDPFINFLVRRIVKWLDTA